MSLGGVFHLACFLVCIIAWSLLSGSIGGDRVGTVGPSDVAVKGLGDQAVVGGFPGRSLKSLSPSRDTAFVASEDGSIHLMDSDSGRVIWSLPLGPPIHTSYQAPVDPENEKENSSGAGNRPFFIDVGEDWELYMYDELFQKTKLPICIDDFVKTSTVISEEGSVALGSRKSPVFYVYRELKIPQQCLDVAKSFCENHTYAIPLINCFGRNCQLALMTSSKPPQLYGRKDLSLLGHEKALFSKFIKLPISIDDFIKTTPVISEEGSVTLGSRKSTVFEVDLFTGRLIRTYGLSFSASSSQNIEVETDENGKDLVESGTLDSDLADRRLKITRTDYILQSFSPKSDKVLWNMTVAEIGAALICDDDSSGGSSRYQLGSDPDSLYDMPLPCQSRAIVYRFRNREQFDAFSRLQLDDGTAHPSTIPRQQLPSQPGLVKPSRSRPESRIVPQLPELGDNLEDQEQFSTKVLELPGPKQSESKIIHHSLGEVFEADRRVLYFETSAISSLVLVLCLGIGIFVFWNAKKPKEQNNPVDDSTHKTSPKRKKVRKSGKTSSISDKKDKLTSAESEDRYSSPKSDDDAWTKLNKLVDGVLEGRKIGKLFVSNVEIAKGSNGTIVLEGIYEGRLVAVKRLVQAHHDVAFKEIQNLIASDRHANIVRWYGVENDQDFVYLALERCTCSLDDLIQIYSDGARNLFFPEDTRAIAEYKIRLDSVREVLQGTSLWKENGHPSSLLLKLMRDVVCGLAHLHELGIIHRDLKPQNVLITKERLLCAKLSDMGISKRLHGDMSSLGYHATGCGSSGWQAPEQLLQGRQTRAVDMFSLGCVLFFCFSGGRHPFGERFERDINIVNNKVDLFLVEFIPEALNLFTRLLNPDPELRPKALDVLHHPLFWSSETRMSFLRDTSDRVELEDREAGSDLLTAMEIIAPIALDGKWDEKLEPAFISDMGRYRRYKYDSIRDLLRLMRNKLNHYRELSPPIQELLGSVPEGFDNYFRSRFPRLLIEVYKVVSNHCNKEPSFQKYFRGDTL